MQKFVVCTSALSLGLILSASPVLATPFTISNSSTTKQTLVNGETGTVTSTGKLSTASGTLIAVSGTLTAPASQITITNSGSITDGTVSGNTGGGRAIRDQSGASNFVVNNNAGALIQGAANDVIAVNVAGSATTSASVVDIENKGTIQSLDAGGSGTTTPTAKGNQPLNLTVTTGSNLVTNFSTGVIWATAADAVRPGLNGVVHNDGLIFSNAFQGSSSDGVDAQTDSGITIVNGFTTTTPTNHIASFQGAITGYVGNAADVSGKTQSTIEGGRHGITGGNTATAGGTVQLGGYTGTGAYTMTVTNNQGATIQGDDGSGINIDGFGIQSSGSKLITNESVSVTNYGKIIGNGVTGDGDGVDVDGDVTIDNFGTIISKNAVPDAGSPAGSIEFSEGVTVGGGSITNEVGGTIEGQVAAGNTQGVGRGITLAGIDHDVNDVSFPIQSIYENSTITNSGTIKGDSESGITVLGTTGGGYTVTISNTAAGTIEGKNTGVSENTDGSGHSLNLAAIELDDTGNSYVINNSGTIKQDTTGTGTAVSMHGASNALNITGGTASVIGDISGDTAADSTLTINPGAGNNFSYSYKISNFTVKINSDGTNGIVTLTGANDYSGKTTISGGTAYIDNTSGSGTGTGKIALDPNATLAGFGIIKPGSGNGMTLAANSSLVSGDVRSGNTAGHGLTLDNSDAKGTILDATIPTANLTFYLSGGSTNGAGSGTYATPNLNSSYITVIGDTAGELKFAATGDTITLDDLSNGKLQLILSTPYLLIKATDDADYSGLVTTGDVNGLTNQDGFVTNISLNSDFTIEYPGSRLYLSNGDLEVVPEPGTWALMLGGLGVIILIQVRRSRRQS